MADTNAGRQPGLGGCGGDSLETLRLILRPLEPVDTVSIAPLMADPAVATRTARIPYPSTPADAERWVASVIAEGKSGGVLTRAIQRRADGALLGVSGLIIERAKRQAELVYWLGRPYWGHGFATEAVARLIRFGFEERALERITAGAFTDNAASIRVLHKLGFVPTGAQDPTAPARGRHVPAEGFVLTRASWLARNAKPLLLVAAAALIDADNRVLLARRPPGKSMAGLWEFPGGKLHPGETPEVALVRELFEELAVETRTTCLAPFACASHAYPEFHLLMPLFLCRRWSGRPSAREGQDLAWVKVENLARASEYPMPPADLPLAAALRDIL
ncbi:MAG: GNAT family N-acetyltransferase [Alphaproteobacteria bacterium]|nr:GNAT family N-acetyltransferase [Alphaproteobacteria bacterium]